VRGAVLASQRTHAVDRAQPVSGYTHGGAHTEAHDASVKRGVDVRGAVGPLQATHAVGQAQRVSRRGARMRAQRLSRRGADRRERHALECTHSPSHNPRAKTTPAIMPSEGGQTHSRKSSYPHLNPARDREDDPGRALSRESPVRPMVYVCPIVLSQR